MSDKIARREFVRDAAMAATGAAVGMTGCQLARQAVPPVPTASIPSYNSEMEYRRLGRTGLWVSAVCLGGHWKRLNKAAGITFEKGKGWLDGGLLDNKAFVKNRADVVSRCMEHGINHVDACTGPEVLVYSKVLQGRRDKMYLGYSWYEHESRRKEWAGSVEKMMEGFKDGLKECGIDHVDVWRITMHEQTRKGNTDKEIEVAMECLERAKKQGLARFTGVSSHDRPWIAEAVAKYPQLEVICTPYTANTKELPKDSVFEAFRKCDVGVFGIKPFASHSIFKGDGSPVGSHVEGDDRLARMAIRYILRNTAITAPIPGLANLREVDNAAMAVKEHRQFDEKEQAEYDRAVKRMWANLPRDHEWLRDWEWA